MEKKWPIILLSASAVAGALVLLFFLVALEPKGKEGDAVVTNGEPIRFARRAHGPQRAPMPEAQPAPWGDQAPQVPRTQSGTGSSLGFIRKDSSYSGGPGGPGGFGGPNQSAQEAAARGDVQSMVSELTKGKVPGVSGSGDLSDAATRNLMQSVVDTVHRLQPRWYREFLSHRSLKTIADRYDQSRDFKAFLKDLAGSKSFHRMLKKYYKTQSMKRLTKTLINDKNNGPQLTRLFFQNAKDPNMLSMVASYGAEAGLPKEMVDHALASKPKKIRRKPVRRANRPQLQKKGFGNMSFGGGTSGGSPRQTQGKPQTPQLPPNIDPEQLKQYQKYMNR